MFNYSGCAGIIIVEADRLGVSNVYFYNFCGIIFLDISTLTLLVGRHEEYLTYKKFELCDAGVVICLERSAICIYSS